MAQKQQKRKVTNSLSLFSKEGLSILGKCEEIRHTGRYQAGIREEMSETSPASRNAVSVPSADERRCLSCGVQLESREEQVAHYKLDWHKYNVKRKLAGLPCVEEDAFEAMSENISSLSGSDSSEDDDDTVRGGPLKDGAGLQGASPTPKRRQQAQAQGSPLLYFRTATDHIYGVYSSVLHHSKHAPETDSETFSLLRALSCNTVWVLLLMSGGHFAGAVFRGKDCVAHKTFHRYTVRAKRGTVQSARDGKHGAHQPRSAGASLRRYNEAALEEDISKLLVEWKRHLSEAMAVFVRLPVYRRSSFLTLLEKDDPRVRNIPLVTKRPTFNEVKRVHQALSSIYDFGIMDYDNDDASHTCVSDNMSVDHTHLVVGGTHSSGGDVQQQQGLPVGDQEASTETDAVNPSKERGKKKKQADATNDLPKPSAVARVLLSLCEAEDCSREQALAILREHNIEPICNCGQVVLARGSGEDASGENSSKYLQEEKSLRHASALNEMFSVTGNSPLTTLMHAASRAGRPVIVWLLLEHGANPAIKDSSGKVPYLVAKDKETRDMFRRFMAAYPSAYEYAAAQIMCPIALCSHMMKKECKPYFGPVVEGEQFAIKCPFFEHLQSKIPSPLTEEMEALRRDKLAERNRAKKKQKKEREKQAREVRELDRISEAQQKAEETLSEREKRALAAERRILQSTPTATSILSSAGTCSWCGRPLAGVVPFSKFDLKFCSLDCVKQRVCNKAPTT